MKTLKLLVLIVLAGMQSHAQKNVKLYINQLLDGQSFSFNQSAKNNIGEDFKLTRVDYYISGISILHDGGQVTDLSSTYLLVRGDSNFLADLGTYNVTNVEGIKFSIGVDQLQNHNDPALQASGAPLAFQMPSMHWGWSSGYRFVALEGMGGPSYNQLLQYHGLFDQNYFSQTIMTTGIDDGSGNVIISLDADYAEALADVQVNSGGIHHGDNTADKKVLENFRDKVFAPGTVDPTGIQTVIDESLVKIYPVPSEGDVYVELDETITSKATTISIIDMLGREVKSHEVTQTPTNKLHVPHPGMYMLRLLSGDHMMTSRAILIK